jgi:glycerol uptake facilitator-like aquaporin
MGYPTEVLVNPAKDLGISLMILALFLSHL